MDGLLAGLLRVAVFVRRNRNPYGGNMYEQESCC